MKALQYFVGISALIIVSIAPSYARIGKSQQTQGSFAISDSELKEHLGIVKGLKETLEQEYDSLSEKFPNIETQIEVTSENAANVLAYAVLTGAEAPKAHRLFEQFYDPYQHLMPETEEEAGLRADIIIGMQEQWPGLIEAIKIKNAVKKGLKDGVERTSFCMDRIIRVRPSWNNLTESFYQPEQQAFVEIEDMDQPRQRAFVDRKNEWQEKHEPMWKRAKHTPTTKRGFFKRKRASQANESQKRAKFAN